VKHGCSGVYIVVADCILILSSRSFASLRHTELDVTVCVTGLHDGKDIQMGIFGLDPGAEINGLHIALDGVAAVKGGDTHSFYRQ